MNQPISMPKTKPMPNQKTPIGGAIQRRLYSKKPQPDRQDMDQYQTQGMSPQNNKKG